MNVRQMCFKLEGHQLVIRTSQTHPVLAETREKQDSSHFSSISGKISMEATNTALFTVNHLPSTLTRCYCNATAMDIQRKSLFSMQMPHLGI